MDCDFNDSSLFAERTASRQIASLAPKTPASPAEGRPTRAEARGPWVGLMRAVSGTHALALGDQAVVSAASFATTVLVARWASPSELGFYSIAISLLVTLITIQESLVAGPYTIQLYRPLGTPAEHAGNSLLHNGLLSAAAIVALAAVALGLSARGATPELATAIWALAAIAPFALLRQFGRRFAFAHLHIAQALMLDAAVATIQLGALSWLGWMGLMSSATACLALGAACAPAAMMWLYLARGNFAIRPTRLGATTKQSWRLGKWLFAGQIAGSVQAYVGHWMLAWIAGATATGVYAACISIVSFANPLIMGLSNILMPRAVLALNEGGGERLWRQTVRDSLLLGVAMALFCAAVAFTGEDLMRWLYHTEEYQGHGHTLTVLALALLAAASGMPASNALAGMERPRELFFVALFAVVLTVVLVWRLTAEWGSVGAAYGFLLGNVVGAAARWALFSALLPHCDSKGETKVEPLAFGLARDPAPAIRVLQRFTGAAQDSGWAVERLAEGEQADIFVCRSRDRRPIWDSHSSLVVKLYKPEAARNIELQREQFASLSRLHSALNGCTFNGWKTFAPTPLYLSESPPALVTTLAPGRNLFWRLQTGDFPAEAFESVPPAIVAAMTRSWSIGQPHGDFGVQNILCDIAGKSLSFIDPGVPTNSFYCDGVSKRWYPCSHDLAYLLYDWGTGLRYDVSNPSARSRKKTFVENILRASIETIGPREEKARLLIEVHACAQEHLKALELSWSPRGLWRVLIRAIASRRIDAMVRKLRSDLDLRGRFETSGSIEAFPETTQQSERRS